jgi:prephenate dehydrogenase
LVATWCDDNPPLVAALDEVISRLTTTRQRLVDDGTVLDLAQAGHRARMNWEHRQFEPVELNADPGLLRLHGRNGGWITAVLRDDDGVRLLGMRPTD